MTPEQTTRFDTLSTRLEDIASVPELSLNQASIIQSLPEGDFHFDSSGSADPHVSCCGDRDCEQQWHIHYPWQTWTRKNGVLEFEAGDTDVDGNSETQIRWRQGEDWEEAGVYLNGLSNEYFAGWAEYWLNAAQAGVDVLAMVVVERMDDNWVDFCLRAAEKNIQYLTAKSA